MKSGVWPVHAGVSRRNFLLSAFSASMLAACRREKAATPTSVPEKPELTSTFLAVASDTIFIGDHYDALDGPNFQPAVQAAIDEAARRGVRVVKNDLGPIRMEMWTPRRVSPFGADGQASYAQNLAPDGIPLVVRTPMAIDFSGAQIHLKGPEGVKRSRGQKVPNCGGKWLGGWMYVIGGPEMDKITVENVSVNGGFAGSVITNDDSNLTDKGFRIQDTDVGEVELRNVELKNFAGEIYYVGGPGPKLQTIRNCHFHGSAQCAFNPGGTGKLVAKGLRAGRAYQVAEVVGGRGHQYRSAEFYDAGNGGATFFGGPSPKFQSGYPYYWAYWDGRGAKPEIIFNSTRFRNCRSVRLGSWMRGSVTMIDTDCHLNYAVGHLRDVDLEITSVCDQESGFPGFSIDGPHDGTTQVSGAPMGVYYTAPSNIRLNVRCERTNEARFASRRHSAAARFYGGLVDAGSFNVTVSGEALQAAEVHGSVANGFRLPEVMLNGFYPI